MAELDLADEALLREMEILRAEQREQIAYGRSLPVRATTVAGVALPVTVGFVSGAVKNNTTAGVPRMVTDGATTLERLFGALGTAAPLITFITLAVALICLSYLVIYCGSFKQTFLLARYMREHLAPAINHRAASAGNGAPDLYHWEGWLLDHRNRRDRGRHVGDANLMAEPVIIAAIVATYLAVAVVASWSGGFLVPFVCIVASLAVIGAAYCLIQCRNVVRDAACAAQTPRTKAPKS
ncbi:hypothetical protein ACX9MO_11630 [Pseudooceanicola sp. 502str34]